MLPPYAITVATLGSPNIINVTLPLGLDVLTYINTANADGQTLGKLVRQFVKLPLLSGFLL